MTDYLESLFEGIDIIVGKRLEAVSYDTTITCIITDDSDAKNGQYLVSDGATIFLAYSEKDSYKKNDSVRVLIPQGNKSENKYIIGKAILGATSTPLTFVSSLEQAVNIEERKINNMGGIKANEITSEKVIGRLLFEDMNGVAAIDESPAAELEPFEIKMSSDILKSNVCNTITLSAEFKTLLSNYDLRSGTYGLRLHIYEQVDTKDNALIGVFAEHIAEFSSKEMFGNPYLFSIYSLQGKMFGAAALGSLDNVKEIDICLYQDNNFEDKNGRIGYKYDEFGNIIQRPEEYFLIDNILVKNIQIGLGTNIVGIEDNTLNLYTYDSIVFDYDKQTEEDNKRNLQFIWYNKDENNKYIGFSDNKIDDKTENYDEMEYLDINAKNILLQSKLNIPNIPTDEKGLNLATDIDTVEAKIIDILTIYKTDVSKHLAKLKSAVLPLENDPIGAYLAKLNEIIISIEEEDGELNTLISYYKKVLKYAYEIQNDKEHEDKWDDEWVSEENHRALGNSITALIDDFTILINDTLPPYFEDAYQSTFDSYKKLLQQDLDKIKNFNDDSAMRRVLYTNENRELLLEYKEATEIIAWQPQPLEDYANRYCIYWYRYNEGYISSDKYKFMGENWERIPALNEEMPPIDENGKMQPRADYKKTIVLDYTKQIEKYAMVIFYNHVKYVSNEIEFTNKVDIAARQTAIETGAISIEHLEKSKSTYFDYNIAKVLSIPIESAYPRQLRARLTDAEVDETALDGRKISWYFPNKNTMLKEVKDWEARGFSREVISEDIVCFSREIKYNDEKNNFVEKGYDTRDFWYYIKDYYNSTALNNTITCKITDLKEEGQVHFEFGTEGTNGTPYTLRVYPISSIRAVTPSNSLELQLEVVDELEQLVETEFQIETIYGIEVNGIGTVELLNNNILKATNWYGLAKIKAKVNDINLSTIYSIPYTTNDECEYLLSGVVDFIYDSYGTLNSGYPNIPYEFYPTPSEEQEVNIVYYNKDGTYIPTDDIRFYPQLKDKKIIMPQMYITNSSVYTKIKLNAGNLEWHQFLTIEQNRFGSKVLNGWDGSFQVNEDNGTILSTMVGAGKKDDENQFYGVLMGDVIAGAEVDSNSGIGLYGYHEGAQSFGFNIDGTAFLGKSGHGRIYFDGNNGVIESGNYQADNTTGMKIDLKDGYIDAYNFKLTSKGMLLNANPVEENEAYVQIRYEDKNLLYVGKDADSDYYLQSANYVQDKDGTYFNLRDGHIDAYNFKLTSNGIKMNSNPDDGEYYFIIENPDKEDTEYIKYSAEGTLDIKVNDLIITSSSRENLLRDTSGISNGAEPPIYSFINGVWKTKNCNIVPTAEGFEIQITGNDLSELYFRQSGVRIKTDTTYYLSGEIKYDGESSPVLQIELEDMMTSSVSLEFNKGDTSIGIKLETSNFVTSTYDGSTSFKVSIQGLSLDEKLIFKNLKLEEGNYKTKYTNNYDRQDTLTKLLLNENQDGIYLKDGVLLVNASAIKTGILQSKNYTEAANGTVEAGTSFDLNNGILKSANLSITSANFTLTSEGEISAKKGLIGGWTISENNLYGIDSNGATRVVLDARENASHAISVGKYENFSNNKSTETDTYFGVTPSGELQARGGIFKGSIYAWGGTIGGISISGDSIGSSRWSLSGDGFNTGGIWIRDGIIGGPGGGDSEYGADIYFQGQLKGVGNAPLRVNSLAIGNSDGVNLSLSSDGMYLDGTISKANSADYATNAGQATEVYMNALGGVVASSIYVVGTQSNSVNDYQPIGRAGITFGSIGNGSSRRFKNSITEDFDSSLLYSLKPVSYFYNDDMGYGKDKRYGFIAEEVDKIAPELVEHDYEDSSLCNALYYNSIITLAVAEIQKLRKELDILKGEKGND